MKKDLNSRREGICQECHKLGLIHVHHKDGNHSNDVLENRIILCPRCHMVVHGRADRGTGARNKRLPISWRPLPMPWVEIRRQYFTCFPRA